MRLHYAIFVLNWVERSAAEQVLAACGSVVKAARQSGDLFCASGLSAAQGLSVKSLFCGAHRAGLRARRLRPPWPSPLPALNETLGKSTTALSSGKGSVLWGMAFAATKCS